MKKVVQAGYSLHLHPYFHTHQNGEKSANYPKASAGHCSPQGVTNFKKSEELGLSHASSLTFLFFSGCYSKCMKREDKSPDLFNPTSLLQNRISLDGYLHRSPQCGLQDILMGLKNQILH